MSSQDYVKAIINNLDERLKKRSLKLPTSNLNTPINQTYIPETDSSPELTSEDITFFQELIGELRWAIEIGRVDIYTEVSMLSAYQASPRRGHLEQLIHIYAYLKRKPKLTLYFDCQEPKIDEDLFNCNTPEVFREQYRDAKEELMKYHHIVMIINILLNKSY